jgi:hypothetical protein
VITNLRDLRSCLIEKIDEPSSGLGVYIRAVDPNPNRHSLSLKPRTRDLHFLRK